MEEMIQQMMIAINDQARYGQEIALEVGNVQKQTEELNASIEMETKEVDGVVQAITEVNTQIAKLK
jgi:methyl-accepting chemotaxis protein